MSGLLSSWSLETGTGKRDSTRLMSGAVNAANRGDLQYLELLEDSLLINDRTVES